MFGFAPPAPQEQMMRAGVLSRGVVDEIIPPNDNENEMDDSNLAPDTKDVDTTLNSPAALKGLLRLLPETMDMTKIMPPGWKPADGINWPKDMMMPNVTEAFVKVTPPPIYPWLATSYALWRIVGT